MKRRIEVNARPGSGAVLASLGLSGAKLYGPSRGAQLYGPRGAQLYGPRGAQLYGLGDSCTDPQGICPANYALSTDSGECTPIPGCGTGGQSTSIDWSAVCRFLGVCKSGAIRPPGGAAVPQGAVPWYSTDWGTALIAVGGVGLVGGGIYLATR